MRFRPQIELDVPLTNGWVATLFVPRDLTKDEADRLCALIQTLPIPSVTQGPPEEEEK